MIKDQYTEPYHPQQNAVESNAIRYLKAQIYLLLDRTGAPDAAWFIAVQYIADVHNICSDPSLPNKMTPLQYQKGVTPDISAFLQFTFWQPILYLDHESHWPEFKERSARWVGMAHSIGDALTFWILDDQSKQLLARSVVRPFNQNLRVKWDPSLADNQEKSTATHGGDVIPNEPSDGLDEADDGYSEEDVTPHPYVPTINQSALKPSYENPGIDTTRLTFPKDDERITRSKGKLLLDNVPIPLDPSIQTYVREGKKPY